MTTSMHRSAVAPHTASTFVATLSEGSEIALVDLAGRATDSGVRRTVDVGPAPWGVAVSPTDGTVAVATARGVALVDRQVTKLTGLIPYRDAPDTIAYGEYRPGGTGIVAAPDGRTFFVGVHREGRMSSVEVVDTAVGAVVDSVEIGERPFDLVRSADGRSVHSIDHDSFTLHTIDIASHAVKVQEIAPFGTAGGHMSHMKPHYAAVAEDETIYLPYQGRGLLVIDGATGAHRTEPMTGDTHQHGVALSDDGRLLVVGVGQVGGAKLGPSLTVRDLATGAERLVELDRGHENIIFWRDPADTRAYAVLTGGSTSRGPWDGLTLVALDDDSVTRVTVPGKPQVLAAVVV